MSLKGRIQTDMQAAMKAGDRDRLKVIRMAVAAIKQQEIDRRTELDDTAVLGIIEKMVKQRRDSIHQFKQGGRQDLADQEAAEITVLDTYLPEPLSQAELDALIAEAIAETRAETGAAGVRDMGKVMGRLKPRVQGRADMGALGAAVKARLAD